MLYLKSVSGRFRGGVTELKMAATQSRGGVGQSGENCGAPIVFGIVNGVLIRKEQVIVTTYPDLHFYVKNTAAQLEVIYELGMRRAMQENPLPQGVIKSVDVAGQTAPVNDPITVLQQVLLLKLQTWTVRKLFILSLIHI